MPIAMKKMGRRGGPAGQDKKVPLPGSSKKKKPAKATMRGGMMKSKGMKKGGKMPMAKDPDTGKMVPAFAVDGKGKMRKGGMMKKKGYAKGGSMKKKGYASGGKMSSKSMESGLKKFLDAGGFGSMKPSEISPIFKELKKLESLRKKRMGGMMKKKGMAKGGPMKKKGMKKGGAMKKKGMKRGGAMMMMKKKGMKKGGVMRGTGAATKGKKFTRAG